MMCVVSIIWAKVHIGTINIWELLNWYLKRKSQKRGHPVNPKKRKVERKLSFVMFVLSTFFFYNSFLIFVTHFFCAHKEYSYSSVIGFHIIVFCGIPVCQQMRQLYRRLKMNGKTKKLKYFLPFWIEALHYKKYQNLWRVLLSVQSVQRVQSVQNTRDIQRCLLQLLHKTLIFQFHFPQWCYLLRNIPKVLWHS